MNSLVKQHRLIIQGKFIFVTISIHMQILTSLRIKIKFINFNIRSIVTEVHRYLEDIIKLNAIQISYCSYIYSDKDYYHTLPNSTLLRSVC